MTDMDATGPIMIDGSPSDDSPPDSDAATGSPEAATGAPEAATGAPEAATGAPEAATGGPEAEAATGTSEFVTCPECGTTAMVNLRRRESNDFCRNCDFPLFWTPSQVLLSRSDVGDDSLRRLPGTTGRAISASIACPHCAELNPVTAEICVRCGLSMQVRAAAPPPPQPVYVAAPEPVYVAPQKHLPWWVWLIVGIVVAGVIVVAILFGIGTIG
jgi:hypothetical protein